MKRMKKNGIIIIIAILLTGGVTGYAATNIFNNLDSIEVNVDKLISMVTGSKERAEKLEGELKSEKLNLNKQKELVSKLREEIIAQEALLADKDSLITQKEENVAKTEEMVESLRIELAIANTDLAMYKSTISKWEAESATKYNLFAQAEQRVSDLEAKVSNAVSNLE